MKIPNYGQLIFQFEKREGEWNHSAGNQALCIKRECSFHHFFHQWLYCHDCVDFLIRESPQDDVISTSAVCSDSSNPATQISATTKSTTQADDVTELAATISK